MKTLADLKRDCDKYEWSLVHSSWYVQVPEHLYQWRRISKKQTNGIFLRTFTGNKICIRHTWFKFPYAKELSISKIPDFIKLIITRMESTGYDEKRIHTMTFYLKVLG